MAKVRSPLLHLPLEGDAVRVGGLEEVEYSSAVVQDVHRVLVVPPNGEVGMPADSSLCWGDVAGHQLQQG